jgi:hypothetical protein
MPRREKSFFGKIMGGDVTDVEQDMPIEEEAMIRGSVGR